MKKKSFIPKIFKSLDLSRDGKGVERDEDTTPNLKYFFKQLWRKKDKIFTVNILMLLMAIPLIASFFIYLFAEANPTSAGVAFAPLYGVSKISDSPLSDLIFSINCALESTLIYNSPVYIVIPILLGALLIAWGWLNVGTTYVMRGIVRGDPVFVWSDFFYGIKRNFKQGFLMGILDFAVIGILAFDIFALSGNSSSYWEYFMFFGAFAIALIYMFMRFYIYLMLITFELNIRKILKNALIFTVLGIKRNLMAFLGIAVVCVITFFLFIWLLPYGIGVTIILPFMYLLGLCVFMSTYAAYPIIKRYMIDPYYDENTPSDDEYLDGDEQDSDEEGSVDF